MTFSGKWREAEIIDTVSKREDGFDIHLKDSWSFWLEAKHGYVPQPKDSVEIYGQGFNDIHGVRINGHIVFQKSDEVIEQERQDWLAKDAKQKQETFDANKSKLDADYETLPPIFKKRIDRLRSKKDTFRVEFESYDMFCCQEAMKIIEVYKDNPDGIKQFKEMKYEDQLKTIPTMSTDHSGNTFGMSVSLAHFYLVKPEAVPFLHGALAALVGCEGYGCHPLTTDELQEINTIFPKENTNEARA